MKKLSYSFWDDFILSRQMERDVEEKLRQKFTLIDRTDPAAIAAAQQVRQKNYQYNDLGIYQYYQLITETNIPVYKSPHHILPHTHTHHST